MWQGDIAFLYISLIKFKFFDEWNLNVNLQPMLLNWNLFNYFYFGMGQSLVKRKYFAKVHESFVYQFNFNLNKIYVEGNEKSASHFGARVSG